MSGLGNDETTLLEEAERRLRRLSPDHLQVAGDFLAYLEEREEREATTELVRLAGFGAALERAGQQAETGDVVRLADIRRDV